MERYLEQRLRLCILVFDALIEVDPSKSVSV